MASKQQQWVLRLQIGLRILILILSFTLCILYCFIPNKDDAVWVLLISISASALVWALVESFTFFVQTYHQYMSERNSYFSIINSYWNKLQVVFKEYDQINTVDWNRVHNIIDLLYDEVSKFPFQGSTFCISKEFELSVNYIKRLSWKATGCCCDEKSNDYQSRVQKFYDSFILIEECTSDKDDVIKSSKIPERLAALSDIAVSFDYYQPPEELYEHSCRGNIGESLDLISWIRQYVTFKPSLDFEKQFYASKVDGIFVTVMKLIFRRIKL